MDIAPCKGMRICRIRKFLLVESGIRKKNFAYGIRNRQGLGIQNTAQWIRNPTYLTIGIQNPSSTDNTGIECLEPGIRNQQRGIQKRRLSWTPISYMGRWTYSSEIYVYENKFGELILLIFPWPKGIRSQNTISIVSCMGAPRCRASPLTIRNGGKETFWPRWSSESPEILRFSSLHYDEFTMSSDSL